MKKIFFALCLFFALPNVQAQTVDDVINHFIEANGGLEKLSSITSLQIESEMNLEQMGTTVSIKSFKEKNKLFRMQSSSPMSEGESFTVVTDTAGYTFVPAMNSPMGSTEASLTKFTEEEFKAANYQKDCEGFFAPLVNYKEKGYAATLDGTEKVNGVECDKVILKLNTGQEMTYYISKANAQVRRLSVAAPIALDMMGMSAMRRGFGGGGGERRRPDGEGKNGERRRGNSERKIDIDYEKYKLFNGIPFPTRQTLQLGMMQLQLDNLSIKINEPINKRWYLVQ